MAERIALIVNPASTRGAAALHRQLEDILAPHGLRERLVTAHREHATELAAMARDEGATIVVVAGGDGTVNEAARALVDTDVALLPVAAGSTNVFTRTLGWAHPATRALPVISAALASDPVRRELTVGRATGPAFDRIFCVNMGFGLDGETVRLVEAHPWIKRRLRQAGFGAMALAGAVRAGRSGMTATVTIDDRDPFELVSMIVVAGSPYAYVGTRPLDLAPGAQFDGNLRWLGLEHHRPTLLAGVLSGAVRGGGRHLDRGQGVHNGWTSLIAVRSDVPLAMQLDGEPVGWHSQMTIAAGPKLTVIVPREIAAG